MHIMIKKGITLLLFLLTTISTWAHTVWIQAPTKAKIGVPQEIKVFFGEYTWEKPTATAKWFSDIRDYKLMVNAPDGSTTVIEEKRQDSFFYAANFVPTQEGTYTFWLEHEVKGIHKAKKLTYTSAAIMEVSDKKNSSVTLGKAPYQLFIPNAKKYKKIIYLVDGQPAADQVLEIIQEGNKEALTVKTNHKGELQFPRKWKGNFLIEIPDSKKVEQGTHHGQPYDFDYKVFSYHIIL